MLQVFLEVAVVSGGYRVGGNYLAATTETLKLDEMNVGLTHCL